MIKGGRSGSKPLDMTSLREMFADGKVWAGIGVVRARDGNGSHFKKKDGDVLVDVDLSPRGAWAWCRLGSWGGGNGIGMWKIPPEGTEVGVIVPEGHPGMSPIAVCTLSSGATPDGLDGDVMIVANTKKVKLVSADETVEINGDDYSLPKTEDLLAALAGLSQALATVLSAATDSGIALAMAATPAPVINDPSGVPYLTNSAAIAGLLASATPYKSTKAKNG